MHAAKATVREVLDRLPDDCSLEDILYHLYVVQKTSSAGDRTRACAPAGLTELSDEIAKARELLLSDAVALAKRGVMDNRGLGDGSRFFGNLKAERSKPKDREPSPRLVCHGDDRQR